MNFFFAQVIYLHAVLLAMLKLLCKNKISSVYRSIHIYCWKFLGRADLFKILFYIAAGIWYDFCDSIGLFFNQIFQIHKENLKDRETRRILQCFAMAFSLTLAIHFYGTMIAGLCCIGIAMGFCFRFVKKEYFCRIMVTGILSVALAVLPMAIAFAGGTPLQGSLGWGMSVINGTQNNTSDTANTSSDNKVKVTGKMENCRD